MKLIAKDGKLLEDVKIEEENNTEDDRKIIKTKEDRKKKLMQEVEDCYEYFSTLQITPDISKHFIILGFNMFCCGNPDRAIEIVNNVHDDYFKEGYFIGDLNAALQEKNKKGNTTNSEVLDVFVLILPFLKKYRNRLKPCFKELI